MTSIALSKIDPRVLRGSLRVYADTDVHGHTGSTDSSVEARGKARCPPRVPPPQVQSTLFYETAPLTGLQFAGVLQGSSCLPSPGGAKWMTMVLSAFLAFYMGSGDPMQVFLLLRFQPLLATEC